MTRKIDPNVVGKQLGATKIKDDPNYQKRVNESKKYKKGHKKRSLLYLFYGKLPKWYNYYIFSRTGYIKRDHSNKLYYSKPYWLWKILEKRKRKKLPEDQLVDFSK
jgi:hypothetical protein